MAAQCVLVLKGWKWPADCSIYGWYDAMEMKRFHPVSYPLPLRALVMTRYDSDESKLPSMLPYNCRVSSIGLTIICRIGCIKVLVPDHVVRHHPPSAGSLTQNPHSNHCISMLLFILDLEKYWCMALISRDYCPFDVEMRISHQRVPVN